MSHDHKRGRARSGLPAGPTPRARVRSLGKLLHVAYLWNRPDSHGPPSYTFSDCAADALFQCVDWTANIASIAPKNTLRYINVQWRRNSLVNRAKTHKNVLVFFVQLVT